MKLITSAAYISSEFASELGRLPPSFLPVGNKRLYSYQVDWMSLSGGDVYLSLPESFILNDFDEKLLADLGVTILWVPDDVSLGESIMYCWNLTGKSYDSLQVLHGDTLFLGLREPCLDSFSVHPNSGYYQRASVSGGETRNSISDVWAGEHESVLSGYFSFSDPHSLVKSIIQSGGNFIAAVEKYVDSHRVSYVSDGTWLDFGHINSYFRSRSYLTTERAFNDLKITSRVVSKSGLNAEKIAAERNWFSNLPSALRIHCPVFLNGCNTTDEDGYQLEYLYWMPLNDLYVYGDLGAKSWRSIFEASKTVLEDFSTFKPLNIDNIDITVFDALYLPKTLDRLEKFCDDSELDLDTRIDLGDNFGTVSVREMAVRSSEFIAPATSEQAAIAHGDFCFSNVLYDSRINAIKVIDPRGIDNSGEFTLYGDKRYDLAKLYHSVVGLYDFIIAGRYNLPEDRASAFSISFPCENRIRDIEKEFRKVFFSHGDISEIEILAINVHLFLSMLPLHYDRPDRQRAMLANAGRLYIKLEKLVREHTYS